MKAPIEGFGGHGPGTPEEFNAVMEHVGCPVRADWQVPTSHAIAMAFLWMHEEIEKAKKLSGAVIKDGRPPRPKPMPPSGL